MKYLKQLLKKWNISEAKAVEIILAHTKRGRPPSKLELQLTMCLGNHRATLERNLWLHSDASDSDFPRPVHCTVPAMKVHAMTTNQISEPTISNIDESLDVNVGMTPTTRGMR